MKLKHFIYCIPLMLFLAWGSLYGQTRNPVAVIQAAEELNLHDVTTETLTSDSVMVISGIDTTWIYTTTDTTYIKSNGNPVKINATLVAKDFKSPYENIVTVAKSGGDYTSIQSAINSITDNASDKPYAVIIYPGTYTEDIVMEEFVTLAGQGKRSSVVIVGSVTFPADLSDKSSLKDLSVQVTTTATGYKLITIPIGAGTYNIDHCLLSLTNIDNGDTATVLDLNGGNLTLKRTDIIYNCDGTASGAKSHYIIDVAGIAGYDMYNCQVDVEVDDVDDAVILINEDSTALGTESFIHNNVFHLTLNNGSYSGNAAAFFLHGGGVDKFIEANHVHLESAGNGKSYFIRLNTDADNGKVTSIGNFGGTEGFATSYGAAVGPGDVVDMAFCTFRGATGGNIGAGTVNIISSPSVGDLTLSGNAFAATYGSNSSVSDQELRYINTLSSNAQNQLDAKLDTTSNDTLRIVSGTDTTWIYITSDTTYIKSNGNPVKLDASVIVVDIAKLLRGILMHATDGDPDSSFYNDAGGVCYIPMGLMIGSSTVPAQTPLHVNLGADLNFRVDVNAGKINVQAFNDAGDAFVPMTFSASDYSYSTGDHDFGGHNLSGVDTLFITDGGADTTWIYATADTTFMKTNGNPVKINGTMVAETMEVTQIVTTSNTMDTLIVTSGGADTTWIYTTADSTFILTNGNPIKIEGTVVPENLKAINDFNMDSYRVLGAPAENNTGASLEFDGVDDYVSVADNADIQNIFDNGGTVSAWIYARSDGEGNAGRIFSKRPNGTRGWEFFVAGESAGYVKLQLYAQTTGVAANYITTNLDIKLDAWNHIALIWDDDDVTTAPLIYINGVSKAVTKTGAPSGDYISDVGSDLNLGSQSTTNALTFDGLIKDWQLFTTIPTADQIEALSKNPNNIPPETAIYTGDFSAGVDGWAASQGIATGNIDAIGGQNDNLRFTANAVDASHFIYKAIHNTIGLKYTVSFDYFIPSGQSNIDQIQLGSELWGGTVTNLTTVDAWTSVEKTFIANITQISFLASDGGSTLFSDAGSDDVFYIRNIVSTQTGQTLHLSANHCDGTTLIDLTGNGNNGTNNGALLQNVPVSTVIENHTETDSDEGRAVSTYYLGRQSGGERFVQGKVEASHNGSADDKKSQVKIYTHNGTDLTLAVTIDENQKAAFADSIAAVGNVSGATYAGDHSVSDAELRRINSLSSNVQTQLDAKEDSLSGYRIPKADGDWDGEFFVSTAGESVVFGDVLYRKSDSKWWKVDADAEASMPGLVIVAVATIAADASDTLMTKGFMFETDWAWTVGNGTANMLFCDDTTPGNIAAYASKPSDSGDILQCVGWVYNADVVFFDPSKVWTEVE